MIFVRASRRTSYALIGLSMPDAGAGPLSRCWRPARKRSGGPERGSPLIGVKGLQRCPALLRPTGEQKLRAV
jgi:hypothetical protein